MLKALGATDRTSQHRLLRRDVIALTTDGRLPVGTAAAAIIGTSLAAWAAIFAAIHFLA